MRGSFLVALTVLALQGCADIPFVTDEPTDHWVWMGDRIVETRSGDRLEAENGIVFVRPKRGDVATALGVILEEDRTKGVVVTACVRDETGFRPGDRLLHAVASVVTEATPHRGAALTPAALRALPHGHAVTKLDDLAPYATVAGWAHLDVLVTRGADAVAVCSSLQSVRRPVPFVPLRPEGASAAGLELARLDDWAQGDLLPLAQPGDVLVTRVGLQSAAAATGLRPLDLVAGEDVPKLLAGAGVPIKRDPRYKQWIYLSPPQPPVHFWVPFLLTHRRDRVREVFTAGPFELIGATWRSRTHDALTEETRTRSGWTFLGLVGYTESDGIEGVSSSVYFAPMTWAMGIFRWH